MVKGCLLMSCDVCCVMCCARCCCLFCVVWCCVVLLCCGVVSCVLCSSAMGCYVLLCCISIQTFIKLPRFQHVPTYTCPTCVQSHLTSCLSRVPEGSSANAIAIAQGYMHMQACTHVCMCIYRYVQLQLHRSSYLHGLL